MLWDADRLRAAAPPPHPPPPHRFLPQPQRFLPHLPWKQAPPEEASFAEPDSVQEEVSAVSDTEIVRTYTQAEQLPWWTNR